MKKVLVFVSCFAVVLVLCNVSFAQSEDAPPPAQPLSVGNIVAEGAAPTMQPLPFGYPPYATTPAGYPAYGVPYSYPRTPGRLLGNGRFAQRYQPYPLPTPGATPGPMFQPAAPPMVAPPFVKGQVPPAEGMLEVAPAAGPPGQPVVAYRPTPIRNFFTLMAAPRPYIGYDPYAAYPPFPGYMPK